jgi:hypothetical protein
MGVKECERLRVFENRVLKTVLQLKKKEVTGGCRKLHNEELHILYPLPSMIGMIKSRRMRWVRHVARMTEKRNGYRLLVRKPEGKRPLGRLRLRWVNLGEMGWDDVDFIVLVQNMDK